MLHAAAPCSPCSSFPTRRSSDLTGERALALDVRKAIRLRFWAFARILTHPCCENKQGCHLIASTRQSSSALQTKTLDRKSTRLNSSHVAISYAVFCLKKQTPEYP